MNELTIKYILFLTTLILTSYWMISNTYSLKDIILNFLKPRGFIVLLFESLLLLQIAGIIKITLPSSVFDAWLQIVGLLLNIIGVVFAIWARKTMSYNWGQSAQHDINRQKELVTHGPFSISRNPIYVGLITFFFGFELALRSYLLFLTLVLIYLVYKAVLIEEKLLQRHFGKSYSEYKKKTPRFLPFLPFGHWPI